MGAPRSGTTLLSLILEASLGVAIPVETHFIPLFHKWLFLWGDLRNYENRKRLLASIYDFLEIWTPRAFKGRDVEKGRRYSLLSTQERSEAILQDADSYADMVRHIFREYASIREAGLWGDKSAFFSHVPVEHLVRSVGNAKVIHIVRDGRDVSLSWRGIWTGPKTVVESAWLWKEHVEGNRRWGRKNPENYCEIRYEDLLENLAQIFEYLAEFLNIKSFTKEITFLNHALADILAVGDTHPKLANHLDKKNKDKWKTIMPYQERMLFECIAGDTLEKVGYEVEKQKRDMPDSLPFFKIAHGKCMPLTSPIHWARNLRPMLPAVIFVSRYLGVPLHRLVNRNDRYFQTPAQ